MTLLVIAAIGELCRRFVLRSWLWPVLWWNWKERFTSKTKELNCFLGAKQGKFDSFRLYSSFNWMVVVPGANITADAFTRRKVFLRSTDLLGCWRDTVLLTDLFILIFAGLLSKLVSHRDYHSLVFYLYYLILWDWMSLLLLLIIILSILIYVEISMPCLALVYHIMIPCHLMSVVNNNAWSFPTSLNQSKWDFITPTQWDMSWHVARRERGREAERQRDNDSQDYECSSMIITELSYTQMCDAGQWTQKEEVSAAHNVSFRSISFCSRASKRPSTAVGRVCYARWR